MGGLLIIAFGFLNSLIISCNEDEDAELKFPNYILVIQDIASNY